MKAASIESRLKIHHRISILLCLLTALLPWQPVRAHPADVYAHTITTSVHSTGVQIEWVVKPGPLLVGFLWNEMDQNQDGTLSQAEMNQWGNARAALLTARLDDRPFPLQVDSVRLPETLNAFQSGDEFITFQFSAAWPQNSENTRQLTLENGMEIQKSIHWFYLKAGGQSAFLFPAQKNNQLIIDVILDRRLITDPSTLLTAWDSGAPVLPFGQEKDPITEVSEQVVPELARRTPQEILLDLVRQNEFSILFYGFALAIALVLGALHALTPGHGKTVVAAYLVGSRGTTFHAIALGSIVTLTHTGSVFLLGLITLAASRYILTAAILPLLEILSGLLIVGLGMVLLWQRYTAWRSSQSASQKISLTPSAGRKPKGRITLQAPVPPGAHHHGDGKVHSHDVPDQITWRSLIALGISGGLVPCPDAIAILLTAIALNRILLGLALILAFSLGLALVLIVIGLLMVNSRRLFDRITVLDRFAPALPVVSAVIVLVLGVGLTWGAWIRAKDSPGLFGPAQGSVEEAQILFLAEPDAEIRQLLLAGIHQEIPQIVSLPNQHVVEFAVSPEYDRVVYLVQTRDEENEIWLADLSKGTNEKLAACENAICSGMVWDPDGRRVVYEHLSQEDSLGGLPSLWWMEINTPAPQPVFQDSQIPGSSPRWSPDGEWLSYTSTDGIRLYSLQSGELRIIDNVLGGAAVWAPDSATIVLRDVEIDRGQFVTRLWMYDLQSGVLSKLEQDPAMENTLAAWSPRGDRMAVVRRNLSETRGDQIWLMQGDGSEATALTNDSDRLHASLNWSPDGKYLLYDVYPLAVFPSSSQLRMVNVESGENITLNLEGFSPQWVWK